MDLYKELLNDEKYKQILESLKEKEQKELNSYMQLFMKSWEDNFFMPLEKQMGNKDFKDTISKKLNSLITTNKNND